MVGPQRGNCRGRKPQGGGKGTHDDVRAGPGRGGGRPGLARCGHLLCSAVSCSVQRCAAAGKCADQGVKDAVQPIIEWLQEEDEDSDEEDD
jgi:hypothetical protein